MLSLLPMENIYIAEVDKQYSPIETAIDFFWSCWGSESNRPFYEDCIRHSVFDSQALPKFYVLLQGQAIIGSYALLRNDIISRQDLVPWLACLYVQEGFRGRGLATRLLRHGLTESAKLSFPYLYLSTDIEGFYEKNGWTYLQEGYGLNGDPFRIYRHACPK